jgi:hypothetical protein
MAKTTIDKKLKFTKENYLKWFESMLLMRKFEEKTGQVYVQQKIKGFCHLYIGQEAIVAGTVSATKLGDKHITAYRDHAHPIGLGLHPKYVMAEMYAKITGCSKGKGGSMHIFSKEHGFVGGHGIVGGQVPLGAGIAFAEKYLGTDNVCVCSMGDGAVRQGAIHETFNMAMTWKLPVIFIVENNLEELNKDKPDAVKFYYKSELDSIYDYHMANAASREILLDKLVTFAKMQSLRIAMDESQKDMKKDPDSEATWNTIFERFRNVMNVNKSFDVGFEYFQKIDSINFQN